MAYKDLLLAVLSYPDRTPEQAIECGVALGKRLGGQLTALALRADFPAVGNRLANLVMDFDRIAKEEEARSAAVAQDVVAHFTRLAADAGVPSQAIIEKAPLYLEGERVCAHARTRDLCLLPIGPAVLGDRSLAEAVLFGSGRPVLVFPENGRPCEGETIGVAAIAWDGSAKAARAVADALPALREAREVRVLVVTGEKATVTPGAARDLVRHLAAHGIEAQTDEAAAAGEPIGQVLEDYVGERWIELLVMGGFGHARVREFVLGGATSRILEAPPCPVLMAH